jgi:hypothetical protein
VAGHIRFLLLRLIYNRAFIGVCSKLHNFVGYKNYANRPSGDTREHLNVVWCGRKT